METPGKILPIRTVIRDEFAREAESDPKKYYIYMKIRELWRPDAQMITDDLDAGATLVVISGQGQNGKSTNLCPLIAEISEKYGSPCIYIDCRMGADSVKRRLLTQKQTQTSRLILDEAATIDDEGGVETVNTLLKSLHLNNFKGIMSIFRSFNIDDRRTQAQTWIESEKSLGGKVTSHELNRIAIPKELAQKFLEEFMHTPKVVSDFLLANFPLYPKVLTKFGDECQTLGDVKEICDFELNPEGRGSGSILVSNEEYKNMRQSVGL